MTYIFHLVKQVLPQRWGRYGWQLLKGIACFIELLPKDKQTLVAMPLFIEFLQLVPRFLMCQFCSQHFYEQFQEFPLKEHHPFRWICERWKTVNQRNIKSGEICILESWLCERMKTTEEWFFYYKRRLLSRSFFQLWKLDVMIFLTTVLRCLPEPGSWETKSSLKTDIDRYFELLHELIPEFPSVAKLLNTTNAQDWSQAWFEIVSKFLGSEEQANRVWWISESCMQTY